jgi:ribosomal protein S27E
MTDEPEVKCKVDCPCGWTEVFSRAFSGLQIECPRCGKTHRIPTFGETPADEGIDMSTMDKLLRPQDEPDGAAPPRVTVPFKSLFVLSVVIALLVSAVALPLLWDRWPVNAAVVGGALSWPVAIAVAWLGQIRHRRRVADGPVL